MVGLTKIESYLHSYLSLMILRVYLGLIKGKTSVNNAVAENITNISEHRT